MSRFSFKKVENPEKYNDFLIRNQAFFTQSSFYGDWQKNFGRKIHNYVIEEGDKTLVYIQFLEIGFGIGQTYLYAPYGPVTIENPTKELLSFLKKSLKDLLKEFNSSFFRLDFNNRKIGESDLVKEIFQIAPKYSNKGVVFQPRDEWVIDLSLSEEDLYKNINSKNKYCIRQAEKINTEIEIISENLSDHFEDFYKLMKETSNRNSFGLHPREYFENIFKSVEQNKNGWLINSKIEGEVVSSFLYVSFGNIINHVFGGSIMKENYPSTSHFVHWQAIKYFKGKGFKYYNFGGISTEENPDKNLISLTRFKTRFGGQILNHSPFYDVVNKKIFYWIFLLKKLIDSSKK